MNVAIAMLDDTGKWWMGIVSIAATVSTLNALLAGGNAVAIRFSNRELAPLWGAGLRFSLAAALLVVAMTMLRLELPRGRALTGALLYGMVNFGAGFALAYYALLRLHAGLAQTLLALVPLATLLLAVAWRQERLRVAAVVGTLLALAALERRSGDQTAAARCVDEARRRFVALGDPEGLAYLADHAEPLLSER
jgi:drug/metabolite transporter (DMT)-like permease